MKQGESLILRLGGVADYDLNEIDFEVFVYPCGHPTASHRKTKGDCVPSEDEYGVYYCTYSPEETAAFDAGVYALEVRDVTNDNIHIYHRQFVVEESASALYIKGTEE